MRWKGDPAPAAATLEDPEVAAIVEESIDKLAKVVIDRGLEQFAAALRGPASETVLETIEKHTRRYEPIED